MKLVILLTDNYKLLNYVNEINRHLKINNRMQDVESCSQLKKICDVRLKIIDETIAVTRFKTDKLTSIRMAKCGL